MTRYLLTPSLYDSYRYYVSTEFKTTEEFLQTMRNERSETKSANMLKGIYFEDIVQCITEGKDYDSVLDKADQDGIGFNKSFLDCAHEVAEEVWGCHWQSKLSKEIEINGQTYLLYGRSDCELAPWVKDIKYTGNYDIGKFRESIQHLMYMYLSGLPHFRYVICQNGTAVYHEDYHWDAESEALLSGKLKGMLEYIHGIPQFSELFLEHWQTKY